MDCCTIDEVFMMKSLNLDSTWIDKYTLKCLFALITNKTVAIFSAHGYYTISGRFWIFFWQAIFTIAFDSGINFVSTDPISNYFIIHL